MCMSEDKSRKYFHTFHIDGNFVCGRLNSLCGESLNTSILLYTLCEALHVVNVI